MKTKKNYWRIDGDNNIFNTLKDAKHHVWLGYTPRERIINLDQQSIYHVINGDVVSYVEMKTTDDGEVRYGRVKKSPW